VSASTTDPIQPAKASKRDILRNRSLLTLSLGHLTVDMYSGVLPILYPLLTDKFELNLKTVGLVSLAYGGAASLTQPIFGYITDKRGTRLIGLALMWTAITFSLLGLAPSFGVLLALAALAGIGSGAYHPMGAVTAAAVIPDEQRNTAMSFYVTGGTLGVAIGPLVAAIVFALAGIHGTVAMVLPGGLIAVFMIVQMRSVTANLRKRQAVSGAPPPIPWMPLSSVISLMMMRAWVLFGISAFIPLWYEDMGYSTTFYAALSTTLLIASALGTVGVGTLADRHGRKQLLVLSSILTIPAVLLFAQFPGYPGFLFAIMIGFLASSTGPLLLVMAQQMMVGRAGVASGLILGMGFVMGAIGVPMMGAVADAYGIQDAMRTWAIVGIVAIGLAFLLPSDAEILRLSKRSSGPPPEPVAVAPAAAAEPGMPGHA
jgi:FSR family fosmidomycin resistance protein-like MFS transporter